MISDTNLIIVAQKPFSPFSLILSFHVFQARDFVNEVVCVFNGQFVCRFSVCRSISPLVHIFPSIALQSFTYSRLQSFALVYLQEGGDIEHGTEALLLIFLYHSSSQQKQARPGIDASGQCLCVY